MSKIDMSNTVLYMLQEHKLLLDLVKNKSTPVITRSQHTQYFNKPLDKTIYELLREALSSQDTEFLYNPKKSCLRVAVEFVLHSTPEKLVKLHVCSDPQDVQLRDEDRELLSTISRKLRESEYTDHQLFDDTETNSTDLLDLIESIDYALAAVNILETISAQITRLYKPALQESQRLKRIVEAEVEQDDEASKEEISSLTNAINLLESGLAGTQQVVYLKSITFPSINSVCTCGNCNASIPAQGILRAKSICTSPENYRQALLFANRAITGKIQESNPNIEQIAARMGYVSPILCEACGSVNIVSDVFLMCFKEAVLSKWLDCPPVERNNDLLCTYSANIVEDVRRKYLTLCDDHYTAALHDENLAEQEIQLAQQHRFAEALPQIKYKEERNELPTVKIEDLYSAETYTTYLAELENSLGNEQLDDPDVRSTLLLRYFLSKLHFTTIGCTPADVINSILSSSFCQSYTQQLNELAKEYKCIQDQLCAAVLLEKFIKSGLNSTPLAGYQDQIVSLSNFDACFAALSDDSFMRDVRAKGINAGPLLDQFITAKKQRSSEIENEVDLISKQILNSLLVFEANLCGQSAASSFEELNLVAMNTPDLVIGMNGDINSPLFITGLAKVIWNNLSACYSTLMYQTLISKSAAIYSNLAFFNGVFAVKDDNKSVRRLLASIKNVSMSSIKTTDKEALLRELLIAVCKCSSMNAITTILNITPEMLLKNHIEELPELHDYVALNYKILLDSIGIGEISVFADGYSIDTFISHCKQDESLSLSDGEYIAVAEAAATLYCAISPFEESVQKLTAELKEYEHNDWEDQSAESKYSEE